MQPTPSPERTRRASRVAACSDDGNGTWLEDARDAVNARCPGALLCRRERRTCGFDIEGEVDDAVLDRVALAPEPGSFEHFEHPFDVLAFYLVERLRQLGEEFRRNDPRATASAHRVEHRPANMNAT